MADNDMGLLAELINAKNSGATAAEVAALMGNRYGDGWSNNPLYLFMMMFLFGNNWNRGGGCGNLQDAELMSRINSLSQQVSDNQNTNQLGNAITSNHDFLHSFANAVNMGFAGNGQAINNASMNNIMGQKDMAAQMASCCCDIKSNILGQTNSLMSRIDQLANGMTQGFSAVAYAQAQQTNTLQNTANANTQRIIDHLNEHEKGELRDKIFAMSQEAQTASIVAQLKPAT